MLDSGEASFPEEFDSHAPMPFRQSVIYGLQRLTCYTDQRSMYSKSSQFVKN